MQKASFFEVALSDRSFPASLSSLKRDVNNFVQGSDAKSANGMVAQTSGGAHLQRIISVTVSSSLRNHRLILFFFTYFSLLMRTEILSHRRRSRPL